MFAFEVINANLAGLSLQRKCPVRPPYQLAKGSISLCSQYRQYFQLKPTARQPARTSTYDEVLKTFEYQYVYGMHLSD